MTKSILQSIKSLLRISFLSSIPSLNRIGNSFWNTIFGNIRNLSNLFNAETEEPFPKILFAHSAALLIITSMTTMVPMDNISARSAVKHSEPANRPPDRSAVSVRSGAEHSLRVETVYFSESIAVRISNVPSISKTLKRLKKNILKLTKSTNINFAISTVNLL